MDELSDMTDMDSAGALEGFLDKVSQVAPDKAKSAERAVRQLRSSVQDARHLRGLLMGGDPAGSPDADESDFPAFGLEEITGLWSGIRFRYMKDLVEGPFDPSKYRTADQIHRAISAGKLRLKKGRGEAFGEVPESLDEN
ncbi:hypothetical protein ACFFON_06530 [Arthrobacter citreus]|uniref:hypothetical protein n=1 Tax=Arthrobacter TaxID=1663 RepID=UPI0012650001|nr:hypothetical protein [Arthrobacter gandavensis]